MAIEIIRRLWQDIRGRAEERSLLKYSDSAIAPEEILELALRLVGYQRGRGVFRHDVFMNGWVSVPFRDQLTDRVYQVIGSRIDAHSGLLEEPALVADNARGIKATRSWLSWS